LEQESSFETQERSRNRKNQTPHTSSGHGQHSTTRAEREWSWNRSLAFFLGFSHKTGVGKEIREHCIFTS